MIELGFFWRGPFDNVTVKTGNLGPRRSLDVGENAFQFIETVVRDDQLALA